MSSDPGDLANLVDLALPPAVSFWPPAIGGWIVAAAALAALTVLAVRALRRYRADAYLREAAAELATLATRQPSDEAATTEAVSSIMKRVAIARYGRERVAALTGAAWAAFIAETAAPGAQTDAIGGRLAKSPGAGAPDPTFARNLLFVQAGAWVRNQRRRAAAEA